ncbi:MAG: hypothetical protein IPM16_03585 [Chloroflexi bacterium]|nr:hypothetical protein [Chloroflexota bacterium]
MRHLFSLEFTFSKRLLGLTLVAVGLLGNGALIAYDIIRQSDQGIGPAQRVGMIALGVGAVLGLTLIPLGRAKA